MFYSKITMSFIKNNLDLAPFYKQWFVAITDMVELALFFNDYYCNFTVNLFGIFRFGGYVLPLDHHSNQKNINIVFIYKRTFQTTCMGSREGPYNYCDFCSNLTLVLLMPLCVFCTWCEKVPSQTVNYYTLVNIV